MDKGILKKKLALMKAQGRYPSPLKLLKTFVFFNGLQHLSSRPFLPRAMCLYVTYSCNLRCKMCGIWKIERERNTEWTLSLDELRRVLSDPLFSKLEYINLNGGEPNLREDLIDIVELLIEKIPRLSAITLNSNGLPVNRAIYNAEAISQLCLKKNIRFSISISMHGLKDKFDEVVGVRGSFSKVIETLSVLKQLRERNRFYLGINCVISNLNLYDLRKLKEWGYREEIPVNFTVGEIRERFNNLGMKDTLIMPADKERDLIGFLRDLAREKSLFNHHCFRYHSIANMLEFDKDRKLSCHYMMDGLILGSDGLLYYCKKSKALGSCLERGAAEIFYDKDNLSYRKDILRNNICRKCIPNTFIRQELEKDVLKFLFYLANWTRA